MVVCRQNIFLKKVKHATQCHCLQQYWSGENNTNLGTDIPQGPGFTASVQ